MIKSKSIDAYDENGMTLLLCAVFAGDLTRVQELLQHGADCNKPQRDDPTATPLWHAEEDFGLLKVAQLLRVKGAR